jgi:hypothetical protein
MSNLQQALLTFICLSIFSPFVQCIVHIGDQEVPVGVPFKIISNVKVLIIDWLFFSFIYLLFHSVQVTFTAKPVSNLSNPIIRFSANKFFDMTEILSVDSNGNFNLKAPDGEGAKSTASLVGPTFALLTFVALYSLVSKKPHLLFLAIAISNTSIF